MLLTVLANSVFGHEVTRREWIGVAMTAAGLAFLAATVGDTGDSAHADYDRPRSPIYVGLLRLAGTAAATAGWQTLPRRIARRASAGPAVGRL